MRRNENIPYVHCYVLLLLLITFIQWFGLIEMQTALETLCCYTWIIEAVSLNNVETKGIVWVTSTEISLGKVFCLKCMPFKHKVVDVYLPM